MQVQILLQFVSICSVEKGYDPRDFAMVASGGAGPLSAVAIARELHIPTVIIPRFPAYFSAIWMLMTDQKHDFVRTHYSEFSQVDFDQLLGQAALLRMRTWRPLLNYLPRESWRPLLQRHFPYMKLDLPTKWAGEDTDVGLVKRIEVAVEGSITIHYNFHFVNIEHSTHIECCVSLRL